MTAPYVPESDAVKLARISGRTGRLERRPAKSMSFPWAWVRVNVTPQAIPAGGSAYVTFEKFDTNDPTVWSTDNGLSYGHNTAGDSFLACVKTGLCVVEYTAAWADDATGPYEHQISPSFVHRVAGVSGGASADSMGWDNRNTFEGHSVATAGIAFAMFDALSTTNVGGVKFLAVNGAFSGGTFAIHNVLTFGAFAILIPTAADPTTTVY